ncbi:hypothetical protein B0H11DRAFT_2385822 [Mycena galericulata]|nr:hypothetical protein B0H11DRAFT_2385822 [Mycena galericulata]
MRLTWLALATMVSASGTRTHRKFPLDMRGGRNDSTLIPIRAPQPLTNAKRLAIGLPPLPPRRRDPTTQPQPSSLPPIPTTCNIYVASADNSLKGYLAVLGESGAYGPLTDDRSAAVVVSFSYSATSWSELDFTVIGDPGVAYPNIFFAAGANGYGNDFGPTMGENTAILIPAEQTAPGSPADYNGVESAVWIYDSGTQAITAQWINDDPPNSPTFFVYTYFESTLFLTGDPVDTLYYNHGMEVTLTCVPPPPS